jgi:hypothetical protein
MWLIAASTASTSRLPEKETGKLAAQAMRFSHDKAVELNRFAVVL